MKFSENSHYLEYMYNYANGDYSAARQNLSQCLEDCRKELSCNSIQEADLLRLIGDMFFLEGNRREALKQYRLSEEADPNSMLTKLLIARFLGEKVGDIEAAQKICDDIIKFTKAHSWDESEEDFSSDEYTKKAEELKKSLEKKE